MSWQDAAVAAVGRSGSPRWSVASHGNWTTAWSLAIGDDRYFVKTATLQRAPMLYAEADGLRALAPVITVPGVRALGEHGDTAFLVLDWLDFGDAPLGAALGTALASLHRSPAGTRYGWASDNFIGGTPQVNGWHDDWATFFCERRLRPQLLLARMDESVLAATADLLRGHAPAPSLLHGDLWSGNAGVLADGTPVLFDPAVYVGDRETDLAMTRLFGGFDASFYRAYDAAWPLPEGHERRRDVYTLYHVLNHLNLFGASYPAQAQSLINRITRHTRPPS